MRFWVVLLVGVVVSVLWVQGVISYGLGFVIDCAAWLAWLTTRGRKVS